MELEEVVPVPEWRFRLVTVELDILRQTETLHTNYDTQQLILKLLNCDLRSFRELILEESITYAKAIRLNYNQSMFTIEFAALNFYNQNRVSYRYILEGYEKEWHYNGKNRIALYTNVPPGDYTFRVETVDEANPELVSNCTLAITILPPWWLSWWATLIYVILGLAASISACAWLSSCSK